MLTLPREAIPVSVGLNETGKPVIFVLEDDTIQEQENRTILVIENGMHVRQVLKHYLGTYIFKEIRFHVFWG